MNGNSPFVVEVNLVMLVAAACCLLPVVLVVLFIRRRVREHRTRSTPPFKGLRRRPAGESLRIKIRVLNEQIDDRIFFLVAVPIGLSVAMFVIKPFNLYAAIIDVAISLIWTFALSGKLIRLLEDLRNYQLGFDGERFVGEELSSLIALGFEIYHDVPFDGFNVDHVLIGKQGVFAVESKTKSKPLDKSGSKEYEVIFDGKKLHWPWGSESKDIEQASNNAKTLAEWLTSASGEPVETSAILTLPGWWVERKAPGNCVYVVNPGEIRQVCDSKEIKLNDVRIRQICHQLDKKCRIEIA